jgi:hypothetical protein
MVPPPDPPVPFEWADMRYDYQGVAFTAYDRDGRGYQLSPVYRFDAEAQLAGQKTFTPGNCVGLLTEDGRWVRRDRPGRYAILGPAATGEVPLAARGTHAV